MYQCYFVLMDSNKIMRNADKTEVLIVGTASRVEQLDCNAIKILDTDISLQKSVKYLGVRMDTYIHTTNFCIPPFHLDHSGL